MGNALYNIMGNMLYIGSDEWRTASLAERLAHMQNISLEEATRRIYAAMRITSGEPGGDEDEVVVRQEGEAQ